MADANVIRIGANNGGADKLELFLKVFGGEVLAAFERSTVTLDKHMVRTIQSGKSAQFPVVGNIGAEYHTPGSELLGLDVKHSERVITIDGLLVSHAFIANIDEAMNHYDVRRIYSKKMGEELAVKMDENVLAEIIKGARASATVTGGNGGTVIEDANLANSDKVIKAQAIYDALYAAAEALDSKDAPKERFVALRPTEYYALVSAVQSGGFSAIHRDYGGNGSIAEGRIFEVAGIKILSCNHVPNSDTTSSNAYHGVNASTTVGVVWTPEAAGTVKLMDLAVEQAYDIRRQGTLMVAKYAVGHGYLRPECCVELRSGALA